MYISLKGVRYNYVENELVECLGGFIRMSFKLKGVRYNYVENRLVECLGEGGMTGLWINKKNVY